MREYKWTFRYEVPKDANRYVTVVGPWNDQEEAQKHAYAKIMVTDAPPVEIVALVDCREVCGGSFIF
jgi:hypothetical protein